MLRLSEEAVRELPLAPSVFGFITFGIFAFLLYVTLRLDK
jgi:hypothetical protein